MIDTERGRGEIYSDVPKIIDAMEGGTYKVAGLEPPFRFDRFVDLIAIAIKEGAGVVVVDSFSASWAGTGGALDWADELTGGNEKKNGVAWAKIKASNRRAINYFTQSPVSIIFCLRASDKTIISKNAEGKIAYDVIEGHPICERDFIYEMTTSVFVQPETHFPKCIKEIENMPGVFDVNKPITKETGTKIKEWIDKGQKTEKTDASFRELLQRAGSFADDGLNSLRNFYKSLDKDDKATLSDESIIKALRTRAEQADVSKKMREEEEERTLKDEGFTEVNASTLNKSTKTKESDLPDEF